MRWTKLRSSGALGKYIRAFFILLFMVFFCNILLRFIFPTFGVNPYRLFDNVIGGLSAVINNIAPELETLVYIDTDSCITILKKGIPFLGIEGGAREVGTGQEGFFKRIISMLTGVEFSHPRAIIRAEIPYILSSREMTVVLSRNQLSMRQVAPSSTVPYVPGFDGRDQSGGIILKKDTLERIGWGKEPLIAIYHTHTSESYASMSGVTHTQGKVGDIVKVGEELVRTLTEKYKIPVIHDRTINDYPKWSQAYINALKCINELIRENPSFKIVLDLHRDGFELDRVSSSLAKETVTAVVGGRKVAKILIVVTTDEYGLPHPNWQKNYNLARLLNEAMNQMYPGLSRGILIRNDGRFNQHVHEHALLLEIGSYESLEDEVILSARMLGDVIASVLEKIN